METYLTIEELADYLKVSVKTLRKWVLNRTIPFHKIMKAVRFRLSEIEAWVDGGCYSSLTEEADTAEGDALEGALSFEDVPDSELAACCEQDEAVGREESGGEV